MPPAEPTLPARHAVALGLLHGLAELLPISSSGHTTLIPWLAGWPYAALDGERRKSFEVALHAGTALALVWAMRAELAEYTCSLDERGAGVLGLALAPAALAGYTMRGPIERRLGGPRSIALGLIAGAVAMAGADRREGGTRERADAGLGDGFVLGVAQASALMPGVSRSGATLSAARARGFNRDAAQQLSWAAGLPVLLGASALELWRARRAGVPGGAARELLLGALAAFFSTLLSARVLRGRGRALLPFALYRCALAGVVLVRARGGAGE